MKSLNILLIGCGPHARRIYLPALARSKRPVKLAAVVELADAAESASAALYANGLHAELVLVEPFSGCVPPALDAHLNSLVSEAGIDGVIIATEPLVHAAYAEWAIKRGLSLLIDKPLTARANVVTDLDSADGILEDYRHLLKLYQNRQQHGESVVMVNAQRRLHPGFQLAERLIAEVGAVSNCPVTSIQSYHCDGQWRLPSEIVTQDYHPYNKGYGKASHSGYHIFDAVYRLYAASGVYSKRADAMETFSAFVQPPGLLQQLDGADHARLFGPDYVDVCSWPDATLAQMTRGFGEVDLSAIVTLSRLGAAVANISINLLHNGFSQRTWLKPGADLYKGNGRVKHEQHTVQQGPFQCIQIHSYQASDRHDGFEADPQRLGGRDHFDVVVFRNPLVAGDGPSMQVFDSSEALSLSGQVADEQMGSELAKYLMTDCFLGYLAGELSKKDLPSLIEDHAVPVQMMSSVYRSHVLRTRGQDALVRSPFGLDAESSAQSEKVRRIRA